MVEFDIWFQEIKKVAMDDFGYSDKEVANFDSKNWLQLHTNGLAPYDAVMQYLKTIFNRHNG